MFAHSASRARRLCVRTAAIITTVVSVTGSALAMDNNQTLEDQCAQKTGGGWEGAGFWATLAYGACIATLPEVWLGKAATELGQVYDDEFGDVTFYKNPQNNKTYYVQKTKSGQYRLGLGNQFQVVPMPPPGKIFLPKSLSKPQPGPTLDLAELKKKKEKADQLKLIGAAKDKISLPKKDPK